MALDQSKVEQLQWGSETGSRRRAWGPVEDWEDAPAAMGLRDWVSEKEPSRWSVAVTSPASMGLRDWVSEKALSAGPLNALDMASMGLRDWVSEKDARLSDDAAGQPGFNGAPRLGLGEGTFPGNQAPSSTLLQWGSETGSRRRKATTGFIAPVWVSFNGAPRLGLGEGKKIAKSMLASLSFNGAPRLGLGEGWSTWLSDLPQRSLQWGSETGSRRRSWGGRYRVAAKCWASMGLRDWVSEKGCTNNFQ